MQIRTYIIATALLAGEAAYAQDDFLPPTMGWSSWNTFGANITETTIRAQAMAMAELGLAEAGYQYINIDDGYFANRDETGRLIVHPTRFPNGMKPVVDYIHSLGLKAGCYSDAGHNTCASYWGGEKGGIGAGLYEHDDQDCEMYFNEMDFDFIKVDFCGGVNYHNSERLDLDERERYTAIRQAIDRTGRKDIVFNACRWDYPGTWISEIADSWRISGDINASWGSVKDIIGQSLYLAPYCSPGHYNDMDMLEVGRGLSVDEDVTHFGMWCIMSSPLLIGCDLTKISAKTKTLLTNSELIAINQDCLGQQAYVAKKTPQGAYVLVKDIETAYGTRRAVALYNPTDDQVTVELDFADIDLGGMVSVRDLVEHADLGMMKGGYSTTLRKHASQFLIMEAEKRLMRTMYEGEHAYLPAYQELKNNQAEKTAVYNTGDSFQNGAGAGWLGCSANNCLQWRNVHVPADGVYDITVRYICGENRDIAIAVNGNAIGTVRCNSGSWNSGAEFTQQVTLTAGDNVIELSNSTSWMPDIDYMTIKAQAGITDIVTDPEGSSRIIDLNGRTVSNDGSLQGLPHGVYIQGNSKVMH